MKEFRLRVPDEFHAKVVAAARKNNRSAQAEYLDRLEKSFREADDDRLSGIEKTLKLIAEKIGVFR